MFVLFHNYFDTFIRKWYFLSFLPEYFIIMKTDLCLSLKKLQRQSGTRQVPLALSCEILISVFICTEPKLLPPQHFLMFQVFFYKRCSIWPLGIFPTRRCRRDKLSDVGLCSEQRVGEVSHKQSCTNLSRHASCLPVAASAAHLIATIRKMGAPAI